MPFINKPVSQVFHHLPRRRVLTIGVASAGMLLATAPTIAQTIEARQWQGATAVTRQPEHVVASTIAEWRSLWSRVGSPAPDMFEAGRMNAVGIFLGRRASEGYAVNVLSTARRRDRIVVVFEERMPMEQMMAQRTAPRPVSSAPSLAPSSMPSGAAGFAAPGAAIGLLRDGPRTASLANTHPTGGPARTRTENQRIMSPLL